MAVAGLPRLPPGRHIALPGRGITFVRELPGPSGAPTILLLHGWTASADLNWFACFAPLARHYRVLAMDHRGHGRGIRSRPGSASPTAPTTPAALIDLAAPSASACCAPEGRRWRSARSCSAGRDAVHVQPADPRRRVRWRGAVPARHPVRAGHHGSTDLLLRGARRARGGDGRRRPPPAQRRRPDHDRRARQPRRCLGVHDQGDPRETVVVRPRRRHRRARWSTPRPRPPDDPDRPVLHRQRLVDPRVDRGDRRPRLRGRSDPRRTLGDRHAGVLPRQRHRAAAQLQRRTADPADVLPRRTRPARLRRARRVVRLAGQSLDPRAREAAPRHADVAQPARRHRGRVPALQTVGVTVNFGGIRAVDGVSIAVGTGEIVGLIGTNGAGKRP